jgi:acetone carboxylase gamma subunit
MINEIYFTPIEVTWKYGFNKDFSRYLMSYEESVNYTDCGGERIYSVSDSCYRAEVCHSGYAFNPFDNEFKIHQAIKLDTVKDYPCIWKRNAPYNHNYIRYTATPNKVFDYNTLYVLGSN